MRTVAGLVVAVACVVVAGCGGGGAPRTATTSEATTTTTEAPTTTTTSVVDLSVVDLAGADLAGADLAGANFYVANLEGADLAGANLEGADLEWAILWGADLTGANLTGANLTEADFAAAYVDGVAVNEVNLSGADPIRAILEGANLEGADLTGANLTGARLHGATADQDTRWPDGFDPVAAGVAFTTTEAPPADLVPNPVLEACVTGILGEGYNDGSRGAHQGIDDPVWSEEEWDAAMLAHTAAVNACTLEIAQDDAVFMAAAAAFRSCMLTQLDAFGITADVHPVLPQLITPWDDLPLRRIFDWEELKRPPMWDDLFGPCDALRTDYSSLQASVFYVEASSL